MRCIETERACRAVGLGLMLSALGCGGKAAEGSEPPPPSYSAPRATPASPPVASSQPYEPQSSAPMNPPPPRPPSPRYQPPQPLPAQPEDLARAAAENVLVANCGQCHGPALTPDQAQGGINYINDIDQLVKAQLIVPLNSAMSRVVVVMRNGSMPPPLAGLLPVTDTDMEVLSQYIDNPRFWGDVAPPVVVDAGIGVSPVGDAGAGGG